MSNEFEVPEENGKSIHIVTLAQSSSGGFDLYWALDDPALQVSELYRQTHAASGEPLGAPSLVSQVEVAP